MKRLLLAGVATAAIGGFALTPAANADPVITGAVSPPVPSWVADFGTSTSQGYQNSTTITSIPGETISFGAGSGTLSTGLYAGSVGSENASPFPNAGLVSPGVWKNYLVAEPGGGSVTISFTRLQNAFQLLWGTVDESPIDYNLLSFTFSGGGGTPETVNGKDIAEALGIAGNGTVNAAVTISNLGTFNTVKATASSVAFEFAPGTPVPEPGSLALLGTGLAALGILGWGMKKRRTA